MNKIHPSAIISPKATLGQNVSVGAFTIVHDFVEIGDNSSIDSYCELGYPTALTKIKELKFGANTKIRSHSVFYAGSTFGDSLVTGHRVIVREETRAGKSLQIGSQSDIQGTCEFGNYVRIHSNVFVGQKAKLEDFVWLFPNVVLTNDPHPPSNLLIGVTVKEYSAIAAGAILLPGITIAEKCLVAAGSVVSKDTRPGHVYGGVLAKDLGPTSIVKHRENPTKNAYPWTNHFHRGYPEEVVKKWIQESDWN